jgi:hypothetical protein
MLVKVLSFGTNWWARFGRDPFDPRRFTRHAAYYNSTGVRCGRKVRRHWIISGLVRFNGVGDFNPHLPSRSIGCTFHCSDLTFAYGGNRLLVGHKVTRSEVPECCLVVIASELHGRMDLGSDDWKSSSATAIAASQLRNRQEVMLLMKPGDWVRTSCGFWQLTTKLSAPACIALELTADEALAGVTTV